MAWPDNECGPDPVKRNDRVEYHGYLPTSAEHKAEIDRRDEIIRRLADALDDVLTQVHDASDWLDILAEEYSKADEFVTAIQDACGQAATLVAEARKVKP